MENKKKIRLLFLLIISIIWFQTSALALQKPIRLAVAGMTHGHISFILGRADKGDFELVGVFDTNQEYGLYSLENNVQVVRILDAARESAKKGKSVQLKY